MSQIASLEEEKRQAASKALDYVQKNMLIGLGTGSTANIFIELLAEKNIQEDLALGCVATSNASEALARKLGLSILPPSSCEKLDIAIDGADEFDPQFRLIKGGGGALLREKIIAQSTDHFIIIADHTKSVPTLGRFPLPVECVYYELGMVYRQLEKVYDKYAAPEAPGFKAEYRMNMHHDKPFLTDLGHIIIDLNLFNILDPENLAHDLQSLSCVVDHGLFLNEAQTILTNNHVLIKD